MGPDQRTAAYATLARPGGGFAMVANDARESLRAQVAAQGLPDGDADLSEFKVAVAEALGPYASGMLIDAVYGRAAFEALRDGAPDCGQVLAVDRLKQVRGGPLEATDLDEEALRGDPPAGLQALKLLVLWRPGDPKTERVSLATRFVRTCADLGMLSLLECIIDLPLGDNRFDDGLVRAAAELSVVEPDLYKTHVPSRGVAGDHAIEESSRRLTDVIDCPWVVLSNGVPRDRFAAAVAAACRGGASGFLAGRAAWAPALAAPDPRQELLTGGVERIQDLSAAVDTYARPWFSAVAVPAINGASAAPVTLD